MGDQASNPSPDRDPRTGRAAARARIDQQASWVDQQIRQAERRGDFDDLPGAGKPIEDLGRHHDPDWWLKQLIEREKITGVLPPALQLRKDDAQLDDALDRLTAEREVRREVEEFNERVLKARYSTLGGPPLITMPRDVAGEVERWRARRAARHAADAAGQDERPSHPGAKRRWRWRG